MHNIFNMKKVDFFTFPLHIGINLKKLLLIYLLYFCNAFVIGSWLLVCIAFCIVSFRSSKALVLYTILKEQYCYRNIKKMCAYYRYNHNNLYISSSKCIPLKVITVFLLIAQLKVVDLVV